MWNIRSDLICSGRTYKYRVQKKTRITAYTRKELRVEFDKRPNGFCLIVSKVESLRYANVFRMFLTKMKRKFCESLTIVNDNLKVLQLWTIWWKFHNFDQFCVIKRLACWFAGDRIFRCGEFVYLEKKHLLTYIYSRLKNTKRFSNFFNKILKINIFLYEFYLM